MTAGYSGSFGVNGVNFILQPTTSGWDARNELGIDGNAHPIYPAYRTYTLKWGLASPADVQQLVDVYESISYTGTAEFDLPMWGADGYKFVTYSGCTMAEPTIGEYYNEYITNVVVKILKVRA